ncbi:circadian clock-controlled protein daywake-like [Cydia amplana]|uniref:circadian clock-controlled protein daywake-like n=1 Tax=Cydia amplana TaxID=1869771 RepID=UPI002FE60D1A
MYFRVGLVLIFAACFTLDCSADPLTAKQEQEIIKYIENQINHFDVHDEDSLNKALYKVSDLFKPYMKHGIKLWNIPVLDPLFLKTVKITQNEGGNNFKAEFNSVWVYGLSDYKIEYIRSHPAKYSFEMKLRFPDLKMLGNYDIDGKLLILELKDHGPFTANLTDVDAIVENKFTIKNGHLLLSESKTDFAVKNLKFHLENLLKGSAVGESINESLNQNVNDLVRDLKPAFVREINRIIIRTLNRSVENLPLAKWQAAIK